jgi:hypothetical protein
VNTSSMAAMFTSMIELDRRSSSRKTQPRQEYGALRGARRNAMPRCCHFLRSRQHMLCSSTPRLLAVSRLGMMPTLNDSRSLISDIDKLGRQLNLCLR